MSIMGEGERKMVRNIVKMARVPVKSLTEQCCAAVRVLNLHSWKRTLLECWRRGK